MNWDAIGAVAEILGAGAVFLSLLYLAIQTRQNTRALRSAAFHQVRDSFSQVSLAMMHDPEMVSINRRIFAEDPDLTEDELSRFRLLLTSFLRRGESAYFQSSDGALQSESWPGIRDTILLPLSSQIGREWWVTAKNRFTKEYAEEITKALGETEST